MTKRFWIIGPGVLTTTSTELLKSAKVKKQVEALGRLYKHMKSKQTGDV